MSIKKWINWWRLLLIVLLLLVVVFTGYIVLRDRVTDLRGVADKEGCLLIVDEERFANAAELRQMMTVVAGAGVRSTGSPAQNQTIEWIETQLAKMPGMSLRSETYTIQRWQPVPPAPNGKGRNVESAGLLSVTRNGETEKPIRVAGAIPYSKPTKGQRGPLIYVPQGTPITAENARGKVVIRDMRKISIPLAGFWFLSRYVTSDVYPLLLSSYQRPYLVTNDYLDRDLTAAGIAGAAGYISIFEVPTEQVAGYWDPHTGTHFTVPAVYVGAREAEELKKLAVSGASARISILAERDAAPTRNLIATLPGESNERIILVSHTDGNTWVQENGAVGLLALADYFSRLPVKCRPRTLVFFFGTGHLHESKEGTEIYSEQINKEYESGTVAFQFALEHLATREILPVKQSDGSGWKLEFTGKGELMGWFVGNSKPLIDSSIEAVKRRKLDRVAVMPGQDRPVKNRVPTHCSFGGIGSFFHRRLVPTIGVISGPWSLWAPSFGEEAVDFERMRKQLLAAGDIVLAMGHVPRETIADEYVSKRRKLAEGAMGCRPKDYPEQAPGPGEFKQVQPLKK